MTEPNDAGRGANVRFPPPFVFLGFALVGVGLRYAAMPMWFPVDRFVTIAAGIAAIAAAFALLLAARNLFARTGQNPRPWTPTPELVLAGPYRYTRNPMYVGMTLLQIGLGLAFDNAWIVLLAPAALLVVHAIAVVPEERYLTAKFGADYTAYRARVRRYI